ncbi:corrinoid ABC transporter substrate-binding protein [Roseibium album]|nr:corrinoid ABC transporter substrate-binding protein [Roseibium album]
MKFLILSLAASFIASAAQAQITVQSCDRELTFEAPPKAAISNDVNQTEMMLALGLAERMAGYTGVSGWTTLDAEMRDGVSELPELSANYPTKDILVGADADFYFAGWNYGLKAGSEVTPESLAPFGIQVYELTESCIHVGEKPKVSMKDLYSDIINLGRIFGVEDTAYDLVAAYKIELNRFQSSLNTGDEPMRVFVYDSGEDKPFTAGRYAMPTALIEAAGGVNVLDDFEKSWARTDWESVAEKNPEMIVIVNNGIVGAEQKRDFMKNNPALAEVDAIRNDRFVTLDQVEVSPGMRNIKSIKKLARTFWGE